MRNDRFKDKYGTCALVTGAAQGLGLAFAKALASLGLDLILIDKQEMALQEAASRLATNEHVDVDVYSCDLGDPAVYEQIIERVRNKGNCRLMVHCAAYGPVKPFLSNTSEELDDYVDVNARSILQMNHRFLQGLVASEKSGGIIIISSMAGLFGTALVAPYAATKAFDWNLGESLAYELAPRGIDVLTVCAGTIRTPNYLKTEPEYGLLKPTMQSPEDVARGAIRRLGKQLRYIPGVQNRIAVFMLNRMLPRRWSWHILNRTMVSMYRKKWNVESN